MARTRTTSPDPALRARLIKTVQTGRRALALDDDTWRALLAVHSGGKRSSTELDVRELESVLRHLRASGFTARVPAAARPRAQRALDVSTEVRKARAIWLWLHELGIVRDPSEAALAAFARRIGGVDALQWMQRPGKLVEALKAFGARELGPLLDARIAALVEAGRLPPGTTAAALASRLTPRWRVDGWGARRELRVFLDTLDTSTPQPVAS